MKISVLGNIIDTEDIYIITDIDIRGIKSYYYFAIKFFNEKEFGIGHFDKNILENLRNTIIMYWSINQSTIPKIEFK